MLHLKKKILLRRLQFWHDIIIDEFTSFFIILNTFVTKGIVELDYIYALISLLLLLSP